MTPRRDPIVPDTVLVTGDAGFLGIPLIRFLLAQGHAVASLDIVPFDDPEVRDQITIVNGDIRGERAAAEAMQDVLVHAAAALPLFAPREIYTTGVAGTCMVVAVAERHGSGASSISPRPRSTASLITIP